MNVLTTRTIKSSERFSRYNGFTYYYNKLSERKIPVLDTDGSIAIDEVTGEPIYRIVGKYNMSTSAWLKDSADFETYVVQENDTYDSIALKKYNNPTYYWIICDFNRIIDPFKEPKPGDVLLLPSRGKNLEFEHY